MTIAPELAFQRALVSRLRADPAIAALVGDAVLDHVPGDGVPGTPRVPRGDAFIHIDVVVSRSDFINGNSACGTEYQIAMRLFAVAIERSRATRWEIADLVRQSLHGQTFPLTDGWEVRGPIKVERLADDNTPGVPGAVLIDLTAYVA